MQDRGKDAAASYPVLRCFPTSFQQVRYLRSVSEMKNAGNTDNKNADNVNSIKRILSCAAGILCAAAMCFAAAGTGVYFYKNSEKDLPDTKISQDLKEMVNNAADAEKGSAGGQQEDTGSPQETNEGNISDGGKTEKTSEKSTDNADKSDNISADKENKTNSADTQNNGYAADNSDQKGSRYENNISGDIHSEATPDGTDSDGEYFTASIKNGETVSEKVYKFTVTHLKKDMKVKDVSVIVNGEKVSQFSGSCMLSEGENTIRIICTYTDKNSAVKRVYKDYTVNLKTEKLYIKTSLSDYETDSAEISFSAQAFIGEKQAELTVTHNGERLSGKDDYSAELSEGENIFVLTAKSGDQSAEKTFCVTYKKPQRGFSTDLYDRTVSSSDFSFYCRFNGENGAKLNVLLNNKKLRGSGDFSCVLSEGENVIRIVGKDSLGTMEQSFTIYYIPEITPEDLPKLDAMGIYDSMTVKGSSLSASFYCTDRDGTRIYSDSISVSCNGQTVSKGWEDSSETGYVIPLSVGENEISVTVSDRLGRTSSYFYTVSCISVSQGEEIGRISISLDCSLLGLSNLCSDGDFPVYEGENGFDVVKRFLEDNGYSVSASGSDSDKYIRRIEKQGAFAAAYLTDEARGYISSMAVPETDSYSADSLGEFDYTQGSGWVFFKNGRKPSYGLSSLVINDGDSVELKFSLCYGNDLQ